MGFLADETSAPQHDFIILAASAVPISRDKCYGCGNFSALPTDIAKLVPNVSAIFDCLNFTPGIHSPTLNRRRIRKHQTAPSLVDERYEGRADDRSGVLLLHEDDGLGALEIPGLLGLEFDLL